MSKITFVISLLLVAIEQRQLPFLRVGQVEVVLPPRGVAARLPAASDGLAIVAQRAREALREVERREVGRLSQERPDALAEGHRVDARNPSRVEIVLGVRLAVGVEADDCRAIGYVGVREVFMLSQELYAQYPLEPGAP